MYHSVRGVGSGGSYASLCGGSGHVGGLFILYSILL